MGRLVDVDALIEKIQEEKKKNNYSDVTLQVVNLFIEMLDEQPTAYDIEKVVAELEGLSNAEADYYYAKSNDVIDREDAIDIVKRGGVDGKE